MFAQITWSIAHASAKLTAHQCHASWDLLAPPRIAAEKHQRSAFLYLCVFLCL